MKAQKLLFDQLSTLKNLPTLPHILMKLFAACSHDSADLDEITSIVSTDPALSAKMLKLVNSAYFGLPQKVQELHQAVVLIGTSGIRNMAICACVHEAFPKPKKSGKFNLKAFWWHSLKCGFLSKYIAAKIQSGQPDEAFVSGLLHDIGKVVLWVNFPEAYEGVLENCPGDGRLLTEGEARLGATHCEVAAWLLERWNFQSMISDAVRYHHESPVRIAQALPMTQIVWIANFLNQEDDSRMSDGVELARNILGISVQDCHDLIEKSGLAAKEVADALGIDVNVDEPDQQSVDEKDQQVQDSLVQNVRNMSLLMGSLEGFLTAANQNDILTVIADGLKTLFDVDRFLYFRLDADKGVLCGHLQDPSGRHTKDLGLTVSMGLDQSLLVKALVEKTPLDSFEAGSQHPLVILDEQLIRLLDRQGICCLPLIAHGDAVGVLVLSIRKSDLPHLLENEKLLTVFTHKGALALRLEQLKQRQLEDIQAKRMDAASDLARRVVHEVNNPLSIVKNYLKVLEIKLSDQGVPLDEIKIVNEEVSRAAHILKKITEFSSQKTPTQEKTDINVLLMDIVKITTDSLITHSGVKLHTNLDPDLPTVVAEKGVLKQVFINLIKNAAEAMESGGNLFIETRHVPPPIGGRLTKAKGDAGGYVEIQFKDDGPGIPEDIKEKVFAPYVSSKTGEHSGLGLSIAYNIVKSLHGKITCKRLPDKGTVFKIELPIQGAF